MNGRRVRTWERAALRLPLWMHACTCYRSRLICATCRKYIAIGDRAARRLAAWGANGTR